MRTEQILCMRHLPLHVPLLRVRSAHCYNIPRTSTVELSLTLHL